MVFRPISWPAQEAPISWPATILITREEEGWIGSGFGVQRRWRRWPENGKEPRKTGDVEWRPVSGFRSTSGPANFWAIGRSPSPISWPATILMTREEEGWIGSGFCVQRRWRRWPEKGERTPENRGCRIEPLLGGSWPLPVHRRQFLGRFHGRRQS